MLDLTEGEFASPNFRYREWYQGCKGKVDVAAGELARLEETGGWVAEPKRDGIWVVAFFDETGIQFYSRTQERKPYSLDMLRVPAFYGCALVGELGFGSQESRRRRAHYGHDFMDVYDVIAWDYRLCTDLDDMHRRAALETIMRRRLEDPAGRHFVLTPQWFDRFEARYRGEPEGLVLKPRRGGFPYCPGLKVPHWMKAKKDHTIDMVLIDYAVSTAETKAGRGMIEHVTCGMYVSGMLKPFVQVGGMPHEMQLDMVANWETKYRGRVVELKHFGQFKSGSLRHPSVVRLRDDKRPADCTFDPGALA